MYKGNPALGSPYPEGKESGFHPKRRPPSSANYRPVETGSQKGRPELGASQSRQSQREDDPMRNTRTQMY